MIHRLCKKKFIFSRFSAPTSIYAVRHIGHLPWRLPCPHHSPRFKSLPVTRLGKWKDNSFTTAAATVTAAASNTGGRSAAVELSLLWSAYAFLLAQLPWWRVEQNTLDNPQTCAHWMTQQHGQAAKSGFRKLGTSRNIHGYTKYIPCIYIKWNTRHILGYTVYILCGYTWYTMYILDIPCIYMDIPCISTAYIPGICRTSTYMWYIPCICMVYTENMGSRW